MGSCHAKASGEVPAANMPTEEDPVNCKCGDLAKREVVKKEGKNKDRVFYHCSKPKDSNCKYWKWEDQIEGRKVKAKESGDKNGAEEEDDKVLCGCGEEAKKETVKKEGKNLGKVFYHCGKKKPDNCKFWKWEDQLKKASGKAEKKAAKASSDESSDEEKQVKAKKAKN